MTDIMKIPAIGADNPLTDSFFDRIREIIREESALTPTRYIPDLSIRGGRIAPTMIRDFSGYDDFLVHTDSLKNVDMGPTLATYALDLDRFIAEFGGLEKHDPFSREYAAQELRLFEFLSGGSYSVSNEGSSLKVDDVNQYVEEKFNNFPVRSPIDWHRNIFIVLSALRPEPGQKVLELGFGMGNLLAIFGTLGCVVSGIDASNFFYSVARRRLERLGVAVGQMVHGAFDMVEGIDERFDFIVFDAAFHHHIDPVRFLERLRTKIISPTGRLVFLNEPITNAPSRDWGIIRDDGETARAIRRLKWFEVGFQPEFFNRMLRRTGWRLLANRLPEVSPPAYIAAPA